MKNLFNVSIFTYIFLILSILSGFFKDTIIIYFILILHELGHFFLMKLFNINVKKITIYPYGGLIDSDIKINTNSYIILLISLGGIIVQIILFLISFFLFKLNIISYNIYQLFINYNYYIIFFNILPIYPLDGFKILNSILELLLPFKKSIKICILVNIIFLLLFMLYLYIFKINNYIILIFLIINFIEYIKNVKYLFNKFYVERLIYDIKLYGLVSVKNKDSMYKNKYNYINGISEKYMLKMFDNNYII